MDKKRLLELAGIEQINESDEMKVSQLITKLEKLKAEHGDLDVMITSKDGDPTAFVGVGIGEVEDDDDFPKDWNMPKGFKWIDIADHS
jgi:hypothetical protein